MSVLAWKIWLYTGVDDVLGRYRRTILGPLWIVISQCAFIFGLYLIRKSIAGPDNANYLLFLAISIPAWNLIASFLIDGTNSLLRSKGYIESYPLPMPIFVIRTVVACLVNFFHLLVVFALIAIIYQHPLTLNALWFIPALLIITMFGFGACLGLSGLGVRFRDLSPAISAVIGLMFVLTPVFWVPVPELMNSAIVRYNPFFYLIEIMREPLLQSSISPNVWMTALLISVGTFIAGLTIYKMTRPTVIYWL
ncbi:MULTISPECIES: ABC transporter permease [Asticcacaulis]|uniref:ABC transporter permease n=1 Tax=Asticcacaulis TaxID=76890 RepID=UPI001AE243B3|nr:MULTISPECIES: ABC transporter permease [Asticcacaulis]MBP2161875.1 ABC-type polysaccharide/polyol phosphate export permease [Asticcacaulis solisilvae]MDR6802921.1 ABC-type polysaccharide/polyol phosphate export permease [Asticcacaulis sp. BE141]